MEQIMSNQPLWVLVVSSIGLISLLRLLVYLVCWMFVSLFRRGKYLKKQYGSWALVTGPTDGIGKAMAMELACQGLNLVLVGRNPEKLSQVSHLIMKETSNGSTTKIKTVVFDFSADLDDGIDRIRAAIAGLEVGVLVNNVGVNDPVAKFFHEVEEEMLEKMIKVNVEATTRVTHAVLPGMVKRRRGAIVNIGSCASIAVPSFPFYALYSSTKAYVDQFARSLYVEYKKYGIDVQCQVPLYVATKMVTNMKLIATGTEQTLFVPSPQTYARNALRWIGYEPRCSPYWPHSLQWCLATQMPDAALNAWRFQVGMKRRVTKIKNDEVKF